MCEKFVFMLIDNKAAPISKVHYAMGYSLFIFLRIYHD
ncbi:hypothetical protein PMAN_a0192 [Pseudoalteromonas marina]|nr:hypothetical protein PMAN_a0192 [Pseudoalteromonas marina]